MDVAVIGGTGAEGFGLTLRLAKAGHHVVIGSRSAEKGAARAADALELVSGDARIDGTTNEEAAASGEQADAILSQGVRMVAAFHTIAGDALQDLGHALESDVLVCGDDAEAKTV